VGEGVIKRKPVPVAEMPANESVIKRKSVPVAEMPANEGVIKRKPVPVTETPANEDRKRITSELPASEILGSEVDSPSKSTNTAAGTGNT
jgi:hypothetical protein